MAQYGKFFYSSSLYGRMRAFFGSYLTDIFDGQEPFSTAMTARIEARLPGVFYPAIDREWSYDGNWVSHGSDALSSINAGDTISFIATGDDISVILERQNIGNQPIDITLYREESSDDKWIWAEVFNTTVNTHTVIPGQAGTAMSFDLGTHGFNHYKVELRVGSNLGPAIVSGVRLRTTDIQIKVSLSRDQEEWTPWAEVPLNVESRNGDSYILFGAEGDYDNMQFVRGEIIMLSSDERTSPFVDRVELRSDDSDLYDYDGFWTMQINMDSISDMNNFREVRAVRFVQEVPAATEMQIRSSGSTNGTFWTPVSAPYRQNTRRLRLTRNTNTHSVTFGPIYESDNYQHTTIMNMLSWDTESFYPLDRTNTTVNFVFSRTSTDIRNPNNLLQLIVNPADQTNRNIQFDPQPYFVTIEFIRASGRETPVVDLITILQDMEFRQVNNEISKNVSAVDSSGAGYRTLQAINDFVYDYPNPEWDISFNQEQINNAVQRYILEDHTRRPTDVVLFLESEQDTPNRTNESIIPSDNVIARAISRNTATGETTGVLRHYQYAAGTTQYMRPIRRELDSVFTPSLNTSLRYRYFVFNGWPNETHIVTRGQSLEDISQMFNVDLEELKDLNPDTLTNEDETLVQGQHISIPNTSKNETVFVEFDNGTPYTEKSGHNAMYNQSNGEIVTDFSSEFVSVTVPETPELGYVDWSSAEKIYRGVINHSDIRDEFIRIQRNLSTNSDLNRSHIIQEGETWDSIARDYAVNVTDLQVANIDLDWFEPGATIIVPPNIILPDIPAEAEFDSDMPFEISIIPNSVRTRSGKRLHDGFIPIDWEGRFPPLEVTYRESDVLTTTITRGPIVNGRDPMPLSRIIRIESIQVVSELGTTTYHEYNPNSGAGSWILENDWISWAPSGTGNLEPASGTEYIVTFVREEVDTVRVHLDSTYFEIVGTDVMWRSPEVKIFDGICTPTEDYIIPLPEPSEFEGFTNAFTNIDYVVEDNDLWVSTEVQEIEGIPHLVASMKGKDPARNWFPTINTGFYYLREQEHYLYSEPTRTVLSEAELPSVANAKYIHTDTGIALLLSPDGENLVKDSVFTQHTMTTSKYLGI